MFRYHANEGTRTNFRPRNYSKKGDYNINCLRGTSLSVGLYIRRAYTALV